MKILTRILLFSFVVFFSLGNRGCVTTDTIIASEGPAAASLSHAKDEQIKGLVAQVKSEQEARELAEKQASLAAANLDGVLFAAEHVAPGLPRNAIEEEAKLGKARLPAPDPMEVIKAKDRVIAILQNEIEKAKEMYGAAFNEAAQAKAAIVAKDQEIAKRDQDLKARDATIAKMAEDAKIEREKHANDIKDALDKKDKEFADYKSEQSSKERRVLVNGARVAGLGLIVIGAIVLAVFKMIDVGGGLVGAGVLVGLISIGIETLVTQPWWPYLCGGVFLIVVGLGIYGIYRLWLKNQLHNKVTAALQDLKDEATTLGQDTWEKVSDHLKYRLGPSLGTEQKKTVASLGLVNPDAENKSP